MPSGRTLQLLSYGAALNALLCMGASAFLIVDPGERPNQGAVILGTAALVLTLTPLQFLAIRMLIGTPLKEFVLARQMAGRVDDVITHERLTIAFQPILDLRTGRVRGVEALSRFSADPPLSPDRWFADAAQVGRGLELELLAVRRALSAAHVLPADWYVGVNVAPDTLRSGQLLPVLVGAGIDPRRIVVEVTEQTTVDDHALLLEARWALRRHGIRLAVDDAGSGYASVHRIVALFPDVIKIDRGLVTGVDHDRVRQAMISAVVGFALDSAAVVVGEGIETQPEREALARLGVVAGQGFLLGRPSTDPEEWLAWPGAAGPDQGAGPCGEGEGGYSGAPPDVRQPPPPGHHERDSDDQDPHT